MNIEGVVRQLPLFEPPIDPALLVARPRRPGSTSAASLGDLNAPLPLYRFAVMLQKAHRAVRRRARRSAARCSRRWRSATPRRSRCCAPRHEIALLDAVRDVKRAADRRGEAATSTALQKSQRRGRRRGATTTRARAIHERRASIAQLGADGAQRRCRPPGSRRRRVARHRSHHARHRARPRPASAARRRPRSSSAAATSAKRGQAMRRGARARLRRRSGRRRMAGTLGGYAAAPGRLGLPEATWPTKELEQIDKQIAAADIRVAIAEQRAANHDSCRSSNAQDDRRLPAHASTPTRSCTTGWSGRSRATYFQSYQLAYDLAKRAERCFRFELGTDRLELHPVRLLGQPEEGPARRASGCATTSSAWRPRTCDQNRREYELTKHVSLVLLDPLALVRAARDRAVRLRAAGGAVRPRLPGPLLPPASRP